MASFVEGVSCVWRTQFINFELNTANTHLKKSCKHLFHVWEKMQIGRGRREQRREGEGQWETRREGEGGEEEGRGREIQGDREG